MAICPHAVASHLRHTQRAGVHWVFTIDFPGEPRHARGTQRARVFDEPSPSIVYRRHDCALHKLRVPSCPRRQISSLPMNLLSIAPSRAPMKTYDLQVYLSGEYSQRRCPDGDMSELVGRGDCQRSEGARIGVSFQGCHVVLGNRNVGS